MSLDKMHFLKSEQKYDGLSAKTAEFLMREQLCDRATWRKFVDQFRYAKIWGPSVKHDAAKVGLQHVVADGDIVTIVTKL